MYAEGLALVSYWGYAEEMGVVTISGDSGAHVYFCSSKWASGVENPYILEKLLCWRVEEMI